MSCQGICFLLTGTGRRGSRRTLPENFRECFVKGPGACCVAARLRKVPDMSSQGTCFVVVHLGEVSKIFCRRTCFCRCAWGSSRMIWKLQQCFLTKLALSLWIWAHMGHVPRTCRSFTVRTRIWLRDVSWHHIRARVPTNACNLIMILQLLINNH